MALQVNNATNITLRAKVDLEEISASETYVHIEASVDLNQTNLS
jgi:hypothetical protein